MQPRLRPSRRSLISLKVGAIFLASLAALVAQDPTTYLTPSVLRVGDRLACRCQGCRNTVGNCPMLHCSSADPMRRRIFEMKNHSLSDDAIIATIVREDGIVALSSPPSEGFGLFTWVMPGVALGVGFLVYSLYVRRNRKAPETLTAVDQAVIDRHRNQIDRELGDDPRA